MSAEDIAKWLGILYLAASGVNLIVSACNKAMPNVKWLSVLADQMGRWVIDFQDMMRMSPYRAPTVPPPPKPPDTFISGAP